LYPILQKGLTDFFLLIGSIVRNLRCRLLGEKMKKIIYNRYGSIDDLQMSEVEIPAIQTLSFG
jgi:hypothetical protein